MTHTIETSLGQEPCASEGASSLAHGRDLLDVEDALGHMAALVTAIGIVAGALSEEHERNAMENLVARLESDLSSVSHRVAGIRGVRH